MRTKRLLTFALLLVGLVALLLAATEVALTQEGGIRPRPTVAPEALPLDQEPSAPAAPDAYPDLVITNLQFLPTDPYVNQGVSIYVTIKNQGNGDVGSTETFYLDLYINPPTDDLSGMIGDYYEGVQGALLDAGESTIVNIPLNGTIVFTDAVSYNLWAQVDTPERAGLPTGWILESDEDNNIYGPEYVTVRTHQSWVQKDHVDFFRNKASTLDVVPVADTVGIITSIPGLEILGDSALALGIFDEPPWDTWGCSPTTTPLDDYDVLDPDTPLVVEDTNQRYPFVHADGELVVAVWEDGRNGPTYGRDIYLRWSDDEGETWQPALQVNDTYCPAPCLPPIYPPSINDQTHPAVAVAPNGNIVVSWQDHRDESFDIYVQAFRYDDGTATLIRCDPNGDCALPCDAATELCNFRVDTDANDEDQILPDIDVDGQNNFFIVWQDQRNGNDDVFAVRSYYTTTTPCPVFGAGSNFAPAAAQGPMAPDQINLCWGDDTRIPDDQGTSKQSSPSVAAVQGVKVVDFDYTWEVVSEEPLEVDVDVTAVYTEPATYVTVAWEDWREGRGDADIYLTYSDDGGETFVPDSRLNDDAGLGAKQAAPAVAVNQWMKWMTLLFPTPYGDVAEAVELPVATIHLVWQDFRNSTPPSANDDPDVFYQAMTVQTAREMPWPLVYQPEDEQSQVNRNDERAWQTDPPWQGEPDVAATSSGLTLGESRGYNAYIVWADGRNYGGDFDNLDIYFQLVSNVGEPTQFVGGNNLLVNDGARLHDFNPDVYDGYRVDIPPHARQRYPSIAATLVADWPVIFEGYVYVAWDDDRILDPFVDRDIYMTRSNMMYGGHRRQFTAPACAPPTTPGQGESYGSGAFVSEIFCTQAYSTTWYIVDWHGVTDSGTYITLQTRLGCYEGESLDVCREEMLDDEWYPKRFPYPDDALGKGAPLQGYDAPGQHIEDENGDYWPQARCIQYRVNFWARDASPLPSIVELNTPFLYDVLLHYELPYMAYLPIIFRQMAFP